MEEYNSNANSLSKRDRRFLRLDPEAPVTELSIHLACLEMFGVIASREGGLLGRSAALEGYAYDQMLPGQFRANDRAIKKLIKLISPVDAWDVSVCSTAPESIDAREPHKDTL